MNLYESLSDGYEGMLYKDLYKKGCKHKGIRGIINC